MPRPFPDPRINDTTMLVDHVQTLTDGWMIPMVLIAIWIIAFIITKSKIYKTSDCLVVSFFLTFVIASLFLAMGVIDGKILMFILAGMILSGIYSFISKE